MSKRKNPSLDGSREDTLTWTLVMDDVLIDAFMNQHEMANRVSGTFTTKAYDNILEELTEKFPDKPLDKAKIKNRIKYIKRCFAPCYDIFKNGLSGFSWNPVTCIWGAEPEVWDKLVEAHPDVAQWMNKPIRNYKKLCLLYGQDRATGELAETAAEIRERNANSFYGTPLSVDEIDNLISQDEIRLDGFDHPSSDDSPRVGSSGEEGGTRKKFKVVKPKKSEIDVITVSLQNVVNVIAQSTAEMVKCYKKLAMPEDEIWTHVDELGFEGFEKRKAYLFLIKNPEMLGALLGCPFHERKEILKEMMSGMV